MSFAGSIVAMTTPWNDDLSNIDYGAVKDLVEWHIASGTDGIVPAGSTGESATLSHQEQGELIAKTVEFAAGRLKILAGAGSNRTDEAVSLAKAAKAAGADGILVITPYYNRPTPEGQYRHFGAIAEQCDLPMVIYNVPSRTGTNMLPDTIIRIARSFPTIKGIKEASGIIDQAGQIIDQLGDSFEVISGDDSLTVPMMSIGGRGVISVIANVAPAEVKAMTAAALAGDFAKAREWHYKLLPLMKACFIETNPGPVKTALSMLGRIRANLRLPLVEPQPECRQAITDAMRKAGLVQ